MAWANWRMPLLLAGLTAWMVYGSLYPFEFFHSQIPGGPLHALLVTWPDRWHWGDAIANILLYVPFGFVVMHCEGIPAQLRLPSAVVAGMTISFSMELAQLYDSGRWASMPDFYANTFGTIMGALAALGLGAVRVSEHLIERHLFAGFLLACWLGSRLYPYVPVIDLHKYWHAVRPLLRPGINAVDLVHHSATYLGIAFLLDILVANRRRKVALAVVVTAVLLGRITIVDTSLSREEILGAVLAIILGSLWRADLKWRKRVVTLIFGANIVVQGLIPFHFTGVSHDFCWVPFCSLIERDSGSMIPFVLEQCFLYGTFFYLMRRSGLSWPKAAALGCGILIALSWARTYIPERATESTDTVLFLSLALLMALIEPKLGAAYQNAFERRPPLNQG